MTSKSKTSKTTTVRPSGNIPTMQRLLAKGTSDAKLVKVYTERYQERYDDPSVTEEWISQRVATYKRIALKDTATAKAYAKTRAGKAFAKRRAG
jgi:hypothetical protein